MKVIIFAAVIVCSTITSSPATAGPATDALISCMSDSTTGKDRKDLARWIFVGMSAHPEINRFSTVTEQDRDQMDRTMAELVTRLITEDCQVQTKLALEREGSEAPLKTAFSTMGKLAMTEVLANPAVSSAFERFAGFLDTNKIQSAFPGK